MAGAGSTVVSFKGVILDGYTLIACAGYGGPDSAVLNRAPSM